MWMSRFGSGARNKPAKKYVRAKPTRTTIRATTAIAEKKRSSDRRRRRGRAVAEEAMSPPCESRKRRTCEMELILHEIIWTVAPFTRTQELERICFRKNNLDV